MARGRTLWEMFVDWARGPRELRYYNPLHARLGASFTLNDIDLKEHNFLVRDIREFRRTIGRKQFVFTDYGLVARSLQGEEVGVRLRMVPTADEHKPDRLTHHILVLGLIDEFEYSKDFYNVVTDDTKKFEVREDDKVVEEYWRINDVGPSYKARVTILTDPDENRRVDRDETEEIDLEYWDYWRDTTDEFGQPMRQFLFVEMNRDDGWFQIWQGTEIEKEKLFVF
jgi:hypothetical protein